MNLGDTFKVRKPPNSLFLDTMEVLNKESWSLLCSSYQWGAKLSSCYCHHITLHSPLQPDITIRHHHQTTTTISTISTTTTNTITIDSDIDIIIIISSSIIIIIIIQDRAVSELK